MIPVSLSRRGLCLAASLLAALALPLHAQTGASLVGNSSMETDANADGWPDKWPKLKAGGSWELENGNHFIRMTATAPGATTMLYAEIPVPAGTPALEVSWRWRISGLKPGKQPWFDARLMMEFADAQHKKTAGSPSAPYTRRDTTGWAEKTARFLVPEGATTLKFMPALFQVQAGTMDLDDIVIRPTDPAPVLAAKKEADEAAKAKFVPPEEAVRAKWPAELHVQGNRLVDPAGKEVWLQGLNASGLESAAGDTQPIKSTLVGVSEWKANAVRLPVKEEFWFGRNPIQKDGGKAYRDYVDQCVMIAANRGAYLILDLHRFRAPKAEHAEFWKDAAERYKNHPAVLFDLFNEPHGISWKVWRDGGFVGEKTGADESAFLAAEDKKKNQGFDSVGMQALVEAVRSTGAKNIVVAGGLGWSFDLTGVTQGFALADKTGNGIMYSWHVYNWHKGWEKHVLAAAAKYPILVGEVGADTHKMSFIPLDIQESPYTWVPDMLGFIQKHRLNWTAWCFHPKATPVMISDWKYTPTPFWGVFAKEALAGKQFELKKMR
ncbi:MAG: cellulase family glycosylhydrolase [Opitutaceae bacterium]|jgi:hypothetical protein